MTTEPEAIPAVDELAQEIRRVDGSNSLGAGALAEALMPFLTRASRAPVDGAEAKPVAWRWHGPRGGWIYDDERPRWWSEPVYTHPAPASPDAEMVEALKRIEGGNFDGAATLALAGDFRGIVERLQGIAREALSKHGGNDA